MPEPHPPPSSGAPDPGVPPGAPRPLIEDGQIVGYNPRDGALLEPVAVTPLADIPDAVARCRAAAQLHAQRDVDERASMLRRFGRVLLRRGEALVAAIEQETGKPEAEAWLHEVVPIADLAAYWSGEGPGMLLADEPPLDALSYPGKRALVEHAPRGVVALITPWNFPVALPLRTIFPALLAGDGVLLKPSEHTPRCAALLADAAVEVFGPDLLLVVQGGAPAGAAVVAGGVDAVVFTGSVATGRKVAHAAAEALIPVSLELGGKDAAVVLDDADLERTTRGIVWGAYANAGQNCAAIERVYVLSSIAKDFRTRLVERAAQLVPGRDFGPLSNPAQLSLVERHVDEAREAGAEVDGGGERLDRPGFWYAPTVVGAVPEGCALIREESFGPVVAVIEVPDEDAAVEAANASPYGLTASVWTRDRRRGERIARRLRAGVVVINNHGFTGAIPALPWTGVGESGFGVTNSRHALAILSRPRALVWDMRRAKAEMWWHPYTPGLVAIGRAMATLRGGGTFLQRVRAFFSLLAGFLTRWKL